LGSLTWAFRVVRLIDMKNMTAREFEKADAFVKKNAKACVETLWAIYKGDGHVHGGYESGWRGFDKYVNDRLGIGYDYLRKLHKAYEKYSEVPELADAKPTRLISLSDAKVDPEDLKAGLTNFAKKSPENATLLARTGRREARNHKKKQYPKNRAVMIELADKLLDSGEVLYRVEQADCIEFLNSLPKDSVDLVLSDIMYHRKFAKIAAALAKAVKRVLTPTGQMAIMLGQTTYPYFGGGFRKHLNFRSSLVYEMPSGKSAIIPGVEWAGDWKPVECYMKGEKATTDMEVPWSFIRAGEVEKAFGPYQQDVWGFMQIIERLVRHEGKPGTPGKTIVDCCCGSGTTLLAGLLAEGGPHRVIGNDINPEMVELAKARCKYVSELMRKHRDGQQVLAMLNAEEKRIAEETARKAGLV